MLRTVVLAGLVGATMVGPAEADQGTTGATKHVLVLHEFEPAIPATVDLARGLRSVLEQPGIVILSEYLDHTRFDASLGARDLARWYAAKYSGVHVDLIVAVGAETLQFLLEWRRELWSHVPIVFCAVFDNMGPPGQLPAGVTGLTVRLPVRENLDLALRLLPKTRRVALISGTSPIDRRLARIFWEMFGDYDRKLEITNLTGLSYEEVRERLAALPEDTLAFGVTMLRDGTGRQLPGPTAVQLMTSRSRVPMFALIDTVLGHGAVGGRLISYERIGREAAGIARRVLDGEAPSTIPVTRSAPAYLAFDARQLERWGIPRTLLPADSEVMFGPPPPFLRRPMTLLALAVVLALESALIGMLLVERRQRRRFEREAREDRARIAHMNRVSVVGELTATLAHEVSTPIASMLNDARAARRFLDAPTAQLGDARASLKAVEEQGLRARDVLQRLRRVLRKEPGPSASSDVSQAVRDALRLVQSDARENGASLEASFPEVGPEVACDATQLQQVLLNLLLNAIDAVRGQPPERCRVRVDVRTGPDSVTVVVRDWGKGVASEARARLFEPFFTTKRDGLGMGLNISRSIVAAHGGTLSMMPEGTAGAEFQFTLPLSEPPLDNVLRVV